MSFGSTPTAWVVRITGSGRISGSFYNRAVYSGPERHRGVTGEVLLQHLGNGVYHLGFGHSRRRVRQLMSHEHFPVNGKKVNIPSYQVRPGDSIAVAPNRKTAGAVVEAAGSMEGRRALEWLTVDVNALSGQVVAVPTRTRVDTQVNEALIVEFYSR